MIGPDMSTSSSGFMPPGLLGTIKGELIHLSGRTDTVRIEMWVVNGKPIEARVRGRETLHVVSLTT